VEEVTQPNVPKYEELSVKNLYSDAMNDSELEPYLPNLEQNSNRLPEREFFFGIMGTVKPDYLKKIIDDANKVRYEANDTKVQSDYIVIDDDWLQELTKHPYYSSKHSLLIPNRKTWQGDIPDEGEN